MAEAIPQIIRIHGPYEDAIIEGCQLLREIIAGQDAATRAELWKRHLEVTKPLHDLALSGMANLEKLFQVGAR
jgi:hypothetical protein